MKESTKKTRRRPNVGDIIEIVTPNGLAFAQYINYDKKRHQGTLLALLPGLFAERPDSIETLVAQNPLYFFFYPLGAALRQGLVEFVTNIPVPAFNNSFPLMRCKGMIEKDGKVTNWWLWDGDKMWRVEQLSPEDYQLSTDGVWGHELLIQRIVDGWTPAQDI